MLKSVDIISQSALFSGLPAVYINEIQNISKLRFFDRGGTVFYEGDACDGMYLILDGQVKVFRLSPDGKEKILHIFNSGEPFGEVAMFSGKNFPANAEATKKSRLLFIPRSSFVKLICDNPSMAMNMMGVLSQRLRSFVDQIDELSLKDVPARLAVYLISLVKFQDSPGHVTLNITKNQLASLLGTIPETLSRVMARMNKLDLIAVQGKEIRMLNPEGLERLAEQGRLEDENTLNGQ
ncbi:MAG: Crp/Fnr family transcriptional regulator [bacterium]